MQLDIAVLQYQNQKLVQKLETQKVEYYSLESKFSQLKQKQQPYDSTLAVVNKSLGKVIIFFICISLLLIIRGCLFLLFFLFGYFMCKEL